MVQLPGSPDRGEPGLGWYTGAPLIRVPRKGKRKPKKDSKIKVGNQDRSAKNKAADLI